MELSNSTKIVLIGAFYLSAMQLTFGQSANAEMTKMELQQVALKSSNAALLQIADTTNFGESELNYSILDGKFKHPLLADQSHYLGFSSKKYQAINNWRFYGQFDLTVGTEKNVPHTAQLDPLGLNPYILVDSLQGDWNKQKYGLDVQAASPFIAERVAFGLGLKYQVHTGARQRDPRPENTKNLLEVRPSVLFKLNEQHALGVNGLYQNNVEDLSISTINITTSHNLYKLIGVGEYIGSAPVFVSGGGVARRYDGNKYGGALNYGYSASRFKAMIDVFYNHNREKAIDGSLYPQQAGEHRYAEYGAKAHVSLVQEALLHNVAITWSQKDVQNTEFHQYQDAVSKEYITLFSDVFSTNLVTQSALKYALAKLKNQDLNWKMDVSAQYDGWDNRYSGNLSQQTIDRLSYGLDFQKYFLAADQSGLVVQVGASYSDAFETIFTYDEKAYSSNFVAKEILYPSNAFLAMDYYQANIALHYNFKPVASKARQFYVKLKGSYLQPTTENAYFSKDMIQVNGQLAVGVYSF